MPQLLELSLYYDLEKASADFTLSLSGKDYPEAFSRS